MTNQWMTHILFYAECLDCQSHQELIDKQRRENPTDGHLQLVMDRAQERLDKRKAKLEVAIAEIATNN